MKYTKYLLGGLLIITLIFSVSCQSKYLTAAKIALQLSPPDHDEALANLKLCVQEDPKNAKAYNLMGQIYAEKNMYQEMLESFRKAESLDPSLKKENDKWRENKWARVFNKGLQEVKANNLTSAREQFRTAIFIDSTKWESYANLGFTYSRMDSLDGAYLSYKKAFELKGDDITTALDYATVCYQLDKWDEAEIGYAQLLELDPGHNEGLIRLPEVYRNQNRLEESKKAYQRTLKLIPSNQDLWFNLGVLCFHDLKDYDCSSEAFRRAVELAPDDKDAMMNLALSYWVQDKYDLAAPVLKSLLRLDARNCDAWELLSGTYTKLKRPDEAREAFGNYRNCKDGTMGIETPPILALSESESRLIPEAGTTPFRPPPVYQEPFAGEKPAIAVVDLASKNVSPGEVSIVSELLREYLWKSNRFNLIERSTMKEILEEQGLQQTGCTDDQCAVELGRVLNVQQMVVGTLDKLGEVYIIAIRFVSVESMQVSVAESVRCPCKIDEIPDSISELADKAAAHFTTSSPARE